jgi:hypothetical protein
VGGDQWPVVSTGDEPKEQWRFPGGCEGWCVPGLSGPTAHWFFGGRKHALCGEARYHLHRFESEHYSCRFAAHCPLCEERLADMERFGVRTVLYKAGGRE